MLLESKGQITPTGRAFCPMVGQQSVIPGSKSDIFNVYKNWDVLISIITPYLVCWTVNNNPWVPTMKTPSLQSSNKDQKPIALGPRPLNLPKIFFSSLPFLCLTAYKLDLVWLSWIPDSLLFWFLSCHPCLLEEPKAIQLIVYSRNHWCKHLIILERLR